MAAIASACALVLPALAQADDITGAKRILCTAVEATVCTLDDGCEVGVPWLWDIPHFVEIDLGAKRLSTTAASRENRSTPIATVTEEENELYLQGVEAGRAFSFVINKRTGMLAAAVAREAVTVSVFGACTPLAGSGGGR